MRSCLLPRWRACSRVAASPLSATLCRRSTTRTPATSAAALSRRSFARAFLARSRSQHGDGGVGLRRDTDSRAMASCCACLLASTSSSSSAAAEGAGLAGAVRGRRVAERRAIAARDTDAAAGRWLGAGAGAAERAGLADSLAAACAACALVMLLPCIRRGAGSAFRPGGTRPPRARAEAAAGFGTAGLAAAAGGF